MNRLDRRFLPPTEAGHIAGMLAVAGAVAFLAGLGVSSQAMWGQLLVAGHLGLHLGLAGAFLIALQFVTGSGWNVALRRIPEALTALLPISGALILLTLLCAPGLYPWTDPGVHLHGAFKHVWLQRPFFLARACVCIVLWTLMARAMVRDSRAQDADPSLVYTMRLRVRSALFLAVFAVTFTLASFDWLMSREPAWASTVFGVYQFAGMFAAGLGAVAFVSVRLQDRGDFRGIFTEAHRHDLGKMLFGMSSFWAYLWYCQYMLIWYVNNPEETPYYIARQQGGWQTLFWANVALNWGVPFLFLLPAAAKRGPKILSNVGLVAVAGHLLDLELSVLPPSGGAPGLLLSVLVLAGVCGLYAAAFSGALAAAPLVPKNDPYLVESLPHAHASHGDGMEH